MSHSEDQQQGHKKGASISRFYLFLSYLVILLVPGYIIYQGVFHSGSDKKKPVETTLSLMSDSQQLDVINSRQPQFAQVAVAGSGENKASITRDSADTAFTESKSTQAISINIESANNESIKTPAIDSVPVPLVIGSAAETVAAEFVAVEGRALASDNEEAENGSAVNPDTGSAVKNEITDAVLSSRSFAEINGVVTQAKEQKLLAGQESAVQPSAYLTDIQAAEAAAEKFETLSADDKQTEKQASGGEVNAEAETPIGAESEETVAASEIKDTSELQKVSEAAAVSNQAINSIKETDNVLSSRSFAEIDQALNVPAEKKINDQQLVYPNNYNAAQDNKTRPPPIEFGIPDNTEVEFIESDVIGQGAAISLDYIKDSDCVSISSKSFSEADAATSAHEKQEILKRQGTYITNINADGSITKINADGSITKCYVQEDSMADTAIAEDMSQVKTAAQTDNKQLIYPDAGIVQPPHAPGSAPLNQWRLPYRPYIKPYTNPGLMARPHNSRPYQPMPYNRPAGSYQVMPANKTGAAHPMMPYNKSGRNYQSMPFNKPDGSSQAIPYNTGPGGAYKQQMNPYNQPGSRYQPTPYNKRGGNYQALPFNSSQTTYPAQPSQGENYRSENFPATKPPAVNGNYYPANKSFAPANYYRSDYNTAPVKYPPQRYYY